ncbi:MAG: CHAT domain-containing protein [Synechococcaceae cyanobacterium RL_1_2]|nr:CHAT domain-containing protein [Synechococcaceae cyanobacterium RL_1_2]
MVLTACQTGLGDDRTPLGFAGLALQSGVRSAIASLWSVDDQSTARLIKDFYYYRYQQQQTKAQALQSAMVAMIHNDDTKENIYFQSPYYWAPFTLIGNWL